MTAQDFLCQFPFFSREGCKRASRSEIGRWLEAGAIQMNAEQVSRTEPMDFPLISIVLFPKGKRITLL